MQQSRPGQLDDGQPEVLDGSDDPEERVEVQRFGEVTIRIVFITFQDVVAVIPWFF